MLNLGEKRKFDMLNNNQVVGTVQVRTEFIPDVNPLQEHEDALRKLLTANKMLKEQLDEKNEQMLSISIT
jgi:hypothetical protein